MHFSVFSSKKIIPEGCLLRQKLYGWLSKPDLVSLLKLFIDGEASWEFFPCAQWPTAHRIVFLHLLHRWNSPSLLHTKALVLKGHSSSCITARQKLLEQLQRTLSVIANWIVVNMLSGLCRLVVGTEPAFLCRQLAVLLSHSFLIIPYSFAVMQLCCFLMQNFWPWDTFPTKLEQRWIKIGRSYWAQSLSSFYHRWSRHCFGSSAP